MTTPPQFYLIPLTHGLFAIVDPEDFEELSKYKWHARWNAKIKSFYAYRNTHAPRGQATLVAMHRQILGLAKGDKRHGDHALHDTLDNRRFVDGRANLRIATPQENAMNRKRTNGASGFKGVCHKKNRSGTRTSWACAITFGGRQRVIGYFKTAEEAARAYDKAAIEHFGEFAHLNFPKETYDVH